jgi:hypothetical protein
LEIEESRKLLTAMHWICIKMSSGRNQDGDKSAILSSRQVMQRSMQSRALNVKSLSVAVCIHELNYYDRVILQFYTLFNAVNYFLNYMPLCKCATSLEARKRRLQVVK